MHLKKLMTGVMIFFLLGCFLCACGKTKDQTRKTTKDANKEIMIGGDNYPPFNYTDENGNMAGIDVEFAREAFHRGYGVEFLSDATGTIDIHNDIGTISSRDLHHATLMAQSLRFSRILSTEKWLAEN